MIFFFLGFFFSIRPTDPISENAFDGKQKIKGMALFNSFRSHAVLNVARILLVFSFLRIQGILADFGAHVLK